MDVSKERQWNKLVAEWSVRASSLGCRVIRSPAAYEIAKVEGPGIRAVIYPHRQGYGSHHSARLRDNSSADKAAFEKLAGTLGLWVKNRGALKYGG